MKNIFLLITLMAGAALATKATAQTLNWSALQQEHKHIASVNVGWDYATSLGVGYAYKLDTKMPVVLGVQFSVPAGNNLTDDFKAKLGGQVRVVKAGNFLATVMAYGIYRQFEHASVVRFQNFGSEFRGVAGYYKARWFVAGEFGFDKAIVTYIKNMDAMEHYYPTIRNGWYIPTGGNFQYGIQAGYSLKSVDVNLKAGKMVDQYFKSTARIPYYCQLGVNVKF
jgi:hypothetical protein